MKKTMEAAGNSGVEILIVEDSATQAEKLRYILERHDYRVLMAGNGRTALAMIDTRLPSLIISDIVMPEMDGYELCRRTKSLDHCRNIPVILLTSLSDPQDVIRGLACGADNFITKPYEEEHLIGRVRYALLNRYQVQERNELPGLEIFFAGQQFVITSDRRQILDLLLSTYEAAIRKTSELSRARDELNAANEQLTSANRELEAFSYTVSHDLRNPLNNIHGICQVLLELYKEKLDQECTGCIQEIFEQAQRMNHLIKALMDFSRLNQCGLDRQPVDLGSIAEVAVAELRVREPERQVALVISQNIVAYGDPRLLRVVMDNLLGNAWKYTGRNQEAIIEFGVKEMGNRTVYFVRDNGAGFDQTYADKLFTPFQRLHDSSEFKGSGIGLATVQRIVDRHGGQVWAEGEEGKGATFYFTLQ